MVHDSGSEASVLGAGYSAADFVACEVEGCGERGPIG